MRHLILGPLLSLALASPAAAQLRPGAFTTVRTTDTTANSLIVGGAPGATAGTGGIKAGQISVNGVGIIGTDGRIPAFSSTYFATATVTEAQIVDSTLLARVADTETISGAWTFTNAAGPIITNTAPILKWIETGGTANEARWRMIADGDLHVFQACTDNEATCNNIWVVDRTGATLDSMTLGAATIRFPTGTAAAPAIAFSADTDVGFMYDADGPAAVGTPSIAVVTAGNQSTWLNINGIYYNGVLAGSAGGIVSTSAGVPMTSIAVGNTVLVLDRTTNDGVLVDLRQDGSSEGSITVSGTTVAYNTFMGAHYTQLRPGQEIPESGTIVVSDGVIPDVRRLGVAPDDSERFVYVKPSTRRNQKAVYGLWFADLGQTAEHMSWGDPNEEVYQVAGLGLTTGWVTDTCGPIAAGDFLASSPVEGLAERQCTVGPGGKPGYDPVNRDYTLGKSLVDVDFSKVAPDADSVRRVRIPLTLKAS